MAEQTLDDATSADAETSAETKSHEPSLTSMAIKDVALVMAALSLWGAAYAWYTVTGAWIALVVSVVDGVFVGLLLASLAHEWGHFGGAAFAGAKRRRVYPTLPNLFRFEYLHEHNNTEQFHQMTIGGHIGHWAAWLLMFLALPMNQIAPITLVGAMFGFNVFASVIEYNITSDTRAGMDPEQRLQALTPEDFRTSGLAGLIGGLFAVAALA